MEYVFYGVARAAVNPPIMGYGQCYFVVYTYPPTLCTAHALHDAEHSPFGPFSISVYI